MNAGQSAEKPFAPKRGETKIALNYHQQRRASVADENIDKALWRFRGWLNVGLKRSKATAILEGQAGRPAADLTRCFPFLFCPHSSSASRFTANAIEFSILSQSGSAWNGGRRPSLIRR